TARPLFRRSASGGGGTDMAKVRAALIQAHANMPKEEAIKKHEELIGEAAAKGAQITCLQEIFFGPYFCAEQDPKWYDTAERDDGPTVRRMQALAKKHKMALVVAFDAVANGYWIGAINRVGVEKPLNEAQFYGSSYFCDPRGRIIGKASETEDEVLVCDLDMDMNREVRNTWQFLRDRRPESYEELVRELP